MGLIISTKEIDSILLNSIKKQLETNDILTLPYKKETLCKNRLIASTITNSFGQDSQLSESSCPKQEKANINEYPMNCIGILRATFSNNVIKETTCSIISYNKILTLITNIYDVQAGRATGIVLTHGSQKYYKVIYNIAFPSYSQSKLEKHNYIIVTFEDLSVNNWFGIESPKIEILYKKEVSLAGYITEINREGLYTINGKILKHQDNTIKYTIRCFEGQEGSPLFIRAFNNIDNNTTNDNYNNFGENIIGLHCYSPKGEVEEDKQEGNGVIINREVFNWIKTIVEEEEQSKIERNIIERLDLANKGFGPGEMEYLIYFRSIHLKEIDLTSNKIKAQGAYYLSRGHYPNLLKLSLNNNEIGDLGIKYLSRSKFNNLMELRLFNNHLTHKAIEELSDSDFIGVLKLLDLSENPKIKDKGIQYLESGNFWNLTELNLHFVGMTNTSIRSLRNMNSTLTKLIISGNKLTEKIGYVINALKLANITVII